MGFMCMCRSALSKCEEEGGMQRIEVGEVIVTGAWITQKRSSK